MSVDEEHDSLAECVVELLKERIEELKTERDTLKDTVAELEMERDALRARIAELEATLKVREGWQLVPKEPTQAMKIAGDNAPFWCADKYRAMLAAAPKEPKA